MCSLCPAPLRLAVVPQTFSVVGSTPAVVTLATDVGVETFTCTAEEAGHADHAGEGEGEEEAHPHSDEISIASGSITWGCVAAEAEEAASGEALSTSEAWGFSMLAVGVGSVGAAVVVVVFLPLCPSVYKLADDMGALAIGALMGGVFLHMMPEAVEMVSAQAALRRGRPGCGSLSLEGRSSAILSPLCRAV